MKNSSIVDLSQPSRRAVSRRLIRSFAATAFAATTITIALTSTTLVHALDATPVSPKTILAQQTIPGVGLVVKKRPGNAQVANLTSAADGTFAVKGLARGTYDISVGDDKPRTIEVGADGNIRGKVSGDGKYEITTNKNSYVGHVTLLR